MTFRILPFLLPLLIASVCSGQTLSDIDLAVSKAFAAPDREEQFANIEADLNLLLQNLEKDLAQDRSASGFAWLAQYEKELDLQEASLRLPLLALSRDLASAITAGSITENHLAPLMQAYQLVHSLDQAAESPSEGLSVIQALLGSALQKYASERPLRPGEPPPEQWLPGTILIEQVIHERDDTREKVLFFLRPEEGVLVVSRSSISVAPSLSPPLFPLRSYLSRLFEQWKPKQEAP